MSLEHRYSRDEISKILKRAAELEHKDDIDDDGEGLTVEELQQVSKEVGLHPKYIQRALDELNNPNPSISSNIFGGPFAYHLSNTANGSLSEKEWEEVVSEIRRIHGGIGKTSKLGNTFEWEQRKQEVGYIQISLASKKDHTKININANYNYYASIIYLFTGLFGFIILKVLSEKIGVSLVNEIVLSALGTLGLLTGARFYISNWMKNKRKTYGKLFKRFQEMLAPDKEKEDTPSITIPQNDPADEEKNISSERHKIS